MMQIGSTQWQTTIQTGAALFSISLDNSSLNRFALYAKELVTWNRKINLTAITAPDEIAEKHFIDSLAVVPYLAPDIKILDMGTGAGFPGLPLKIIMPDLKMTLIDASIKKVSFLKHIIRILNLKHIWARHIRAEEFSQEQVANKKFDVVLCRAFSSLNNFFFLALPFLKKGGKALALKGSLPFEEIYSIGGTESETQSICWHGHHIKLDLYTYQLPYSKGNRSLVSFTLE
jgi:16S rRNA (guanine527-N7)-methyltransferase